MAAVCSFYPSKSLVLACHRQISVPLAPSLAAQKSEPPAFVWAQSPSENPVITTESSGRIAAPNILSDNEVPSCVACEATGQGGTLGGLMAAENQRQASWLWSEVGLIRWRVLVIFMIGCPKLLAQVEIERGTKHCYVQMCRYPF